jgi:DNA adenine methylase
VSSGGQLRAPFPWFGGKRLVADHVWQRFGDVATYNEPFAGSLAVLLNRPTPPRVETVNDLDCYLANFWRALQRDPEQVASYADWPVNEADLHARHCWLVEHARLQAERVMTDPDFYDAKIAGWWVWGQCLWIGSGWCQTPEWSGRANAGRRARGIHVEQFDRNAHGTVHQKRRPQLTHDQGVSIERKRPILPERGYPGVHRSSINRRWQGGGAGAGSGVIAPRLTRQTPDMSGSRGASGRGVHSLALGRRSDGLFEYMNDLAVRLRRVRVCCGDWARVLTPSVTTYIGTCGVFLDPPYAQDLRERCYSEDHDISGAVRLWALEHGDDPDFRIALCGYEGEHDMPSTWECLGWKAHGGYSRSARGVANRSRERIWFSPHCHRPGLNFEAVS